MEGVFPMIEDINMWSAVYLPNDGKGTTKTDFSSKEEAWDYIFSRMCAVCKGMRRQYLDGVPENWDKDTESQSYPPCASEWVVIPTTKYMECKTFEDIADAAGWVRIHDKVDGD